MKVSAAGYFATYLKYNMYQNVLVDHYRNLDNLKDYPNYEAHWSQEAPVESPLFL